MKQMKKILYLTVFIIFSTVIFATQSETYYKKGLEVKDLEEKIKYFTVSLKLDVTFKDALISRAETYFQQNLIGEAVKDLEDYLNQFPAIARVFVLKGKIAQINGLLDKALVHFDNALKLDKGNDEAFFRKGIILVTIGQIKKKYSLYDKAQEYFKNVKSQSVYYNLSLAQAAKCLEYNQKYFEALGVYETLAKQKDANSSFHFNAGRLYYMNENFKNAVSSLNAACKVTFLDQTYKIFYAIFRYYILIVNFQEEVSGVYQLNLFLDKLPSYPLGELFQKKILPEEFLQKTISEDVLHNVTPRRQQTLRGEVYCQLGYYYILEKNIKKALEYFKKSADFDSFGTYFYYLSKYEYQKLSIAEEMKLNK